MGEGGIWDEGHVNAGLLLAVVKGRADPQRLISNSDCLSLKTRPDQVGHVLLVTSHTGSVFCYTGGALSLSQLEEGLVQTGPAFTAACRCKECVLILFFKTSVQLTLNEHVSRPALGTEI